MSNHTYSGRCFCGAVQLAVSGQPEVMGYCHCQSCRSWSAGPINAFTLWRPAALQITRGQEQIDSYHKTEQSHRKWCKACGGHLFTEHPAWGLVDIYAATIPDLQFQPMLHVHYGETRLRVRDGLPKQRDLPTAFGGSGVELPE